MEITQEHLISDLGVNRLEVVENDFKSNILTQIKEEISSTVGFKGDDYGIYAHYPGGGGKSFGDFGTYPSPQN